MAHLASLAIALANNVFQFGVKLMISLLNKYISGSFKNETISSNSAFFINIVEMKSQYLVGDFPKFIGIVLHDEKFSNGKKIKLPINYW
jgi:hypothetical protein